MGYPDRMQRREHGRYQVWFPVRVETGGVDAMAFNHNIGSGGMLIAIGTDLQVGEAVTVTFQLPPDGKQRQVKGTILRIEDNVEDPEGMWPQRMAVSFDEVDDDLIPLLESAANYLESLS